MTPETFFEKFDQLADVPNAVGKMRELVLEWATAGRLVEQSRDDATADALVERIEKHLAVLRGRKEVRGAPVEPLNCEGLREIPTTWRWVRLGNVVSYGSSEKVESADIPDDAWLLDLEDIEKDTSRLLRRKAFLDSPSKSTKAAFHAGDVLYGKLRPYLNKVLVADAPGYCTTEIIPIRTFGLIEPAYLCYALRSPAFLAYANSKSYGMNLPRLGTEDARRAAIPLPPLAEQRRIAAKVDELMTLCDQLEAQQQERETRQSALARAALARFAGEPSAANVMFLFHDSYAISPIDIRRSILTLAVQGKLVTQNPEDESLDHSYPGLMTHVDNSGRDFQIPCRWSWCKYRHLTTLVTSGSRGWKDYYASAGAIFVRTQNIKTDRLVLDDVAYVQLPDSVEGKRAKVLRDDILVTITGANVTKAAHVAEDLSEAYISQHIALTRPRWRAMAPWLHLCFLSPGSARGTLESLAYGDKPGLNLNNIRDLVLPIPPLAEQRRIVAKVDQLVHLVEQLETQCNDASDLGTSLLEAVVAELAA